MASKKKKNKQRATYQDTRKDIAALIDKVSLLYMDAKDNKDKIAMWGLSFAHEDLVKLHARIGNLRSTTKNFND